MSSGIISKILCDRVSGSEDVIALCAGVVTLCDRLLIYAAAGEVLFADVLLLPNGMSKVGANA